MIDKFTYGKTPAAIYLADQLNRLGDPRLNRKVTRLLTSFNEVVNELLAANKAGLLSAHTVGTFIAALRQRAQTASQCFAQDSLIADLTSNIMTGKVKELQRRVLTVRHWEQTLSRTTTPEFRKSFASVYTLSAVVDPISPESLTERSKQRAARKGKQSFL
jgi:hypothetical protein